MANLPLAPRLLVRKEKYNGDLWGTYPVTLLVATVQQTVVWQPRGTFINRNQGWTMRHDHLQFFYPQRWYVISVAYGFSGYLHHCYCDIVLPWQPPQAGVPELSFVDLELDLHAELGGYSRIHDEDEFAAAITSMHYTPEVQLGARQALQDLIDAVPNWDSPFASIPRQLPRADLHLLNTAGPDWQIALTRLGLH